MRRTMWTEKCSTVTEMETAGTMTIYGIVIALYTFALNDQTNLKNTIINCIRQWGDD